MVQPPGRGLATGTDGLPVLNTLAQPVMAGAAAGAALGGTMSAGGMASAPAMHSYESLNTPSVWRNNRSQAAAKVDALASNGMDEIEIPAFLRKQAD